MSRKDIGEEVLRCLIVTVACPLGAKVPRLADDAKKPSQIADGIEIRRKTPPIGIGRRDLPPEFVHQYVIELTKDSAIPAAPSILSKYICDRLRVDQSVWRFMVLVLTQTTNKSGAYSSRDWRNVGLL
jgi:hypothetical protein